ncbi:Bone morphogenetic protein 1 [Bulinus truncatus]|nr:Bone morphogenetic protein 1 [Bulinus truncatus]
MLMKLIQISKSGQRDAVIGDKKGQQLLGGNNFGAMASYLMRDEYVDILLDNVKDLHKSSFEVKNYSEVDSLDEPYDFGSVMHYNTHQFAKESTKGTIKVIKQPDQKETLSIGQRSKLSSGDIRQTNKLYDCPKCGATLFLPHGSLNLSAGQEQPMPCTWRLRAPYDQKIQLNITSIKITTSVECKTNYLEAGGCGLSSVPQTKEDKFTADYVILCGGDLQKDEDVIVSPNYPGDYLPDEHCVWNITVQAGFVVALTFEYLDLADYDKCTNDFLEVRNGHGHSAELLGRYCEIKANLKEIRSLETRCL